MQNEDDGDPEQEFYRDAVGWEDRLVRLVGTVLVVAFLLFVVEGSARIALASAIGAAGLLYTCLWPLRAYSVRGSELRHDRWPRRDSVQLDELTTVEIRWILSLGNTLRFHDRRGGFVVIPVSDATHELRAVVGERMRAAHPQIARTSILGSGAAGSLGLIADHAPPRTKPTRDRPRKPWSW